jgi:Zn-dependent M28 family amino/carboxypeptidase
MKKVLPLTIIMLGLQIIAFAQQDSAARFASTITVEDLRKHLTVVAGDEMEGRETGTEGQRKAAGYIEAQFKATGLLAPDSIKSFQQLFPLYQDSLLSTSLVIRGKAAEAGKDFYSQANLAKSGKLKARKIVFVGYGIDDNKYSDYTGVDVKGKIVILFTGEPKANGKYIVSGTSRSSSWTYPGTAKKIATAAAHGAAGVFVISPAQSVFSSRTIELSKKTSVFYPRKDSPAIGHALLSHAFAASLFKNNFDTLLRLATSGQPFGKDWTFEKKAKISFSYNKMRDTINASNVIGVLEGSDKKDEFVFLTAHYDHLGKHDGKIFYGADDDGSGTCAVIEMAEAFAQAKVSGFGPRRTLVFMTVSGEEKGLWGSEYYSDNPIFPLAKTVADLNTDMVGRTDTERKGADSLNYVYVIGHDKLSTDLPIINEGVNKKYTNLVLDYKYDNPTDQNRIYYRSDHYNFARKGVPILFFYDGMLKADYHKATDTVDKINWDLYQKRVRMIFHTAWEIANRDDTLKRDLQLIADEE